VKERFGSLDDALAALGRLVAAGAEPAPAREVLGRSYAPERQVAGRFELRGPGVRGGVDVRGDGSTEAFVGRLRRRVVERLDGEAPVDALARRMPRR
jgi:hypothetical protein